MPIQMEEAEVVEAEAEVEVEVDGGEEDLGVVEH
jgi:hypothetical protein